MEQSPLDAGPTDASQPAADPRGALVPPPTHPPTALAAASDPPPRPPRARVVRSLGVPSELRVSLERLLDAVDAAADRVAEAAGLRPRPRDPSSAYDGPIAGPPPPA